MRADEAIGAGHQHALAVQAAGFGVKSICMEWVGQLVSHGYRSPGERRSTRNVVLAVRPTSDAPEIVPSGRVQGLGVQRDLDLAAKEIDQDGHPLTVRHILEQAQAVREDAPDHAHLVTRRKARC
jgi:hypothetical protein